MNHTQSERESFIIEKCRNKLKFINAKKKAEENPPFYVTFFFLINNCYNPKSKKKKDFQTFHLDDDGVKNFQF